MAKSDKKKIVSLGRPPIVAVLGHVDHGKTSLLDKIRQTNAAATEAGGITQHINAYQIDYHSSKITFIDTPGHVAFAEMRSWGAKVADLALLVVAADEGIKPQTVECLQYIKDARINYLVALNKIDLPDINLERVKKMLAEGGIPVEGYGGDVVVAPVSAKTGAGIDDLLEMILLLAQMADIKSSPESELEAVVIESKMDQRRGVTATVLVRNGSLKIGEQIMVGRVLAKVRAMFDSAGKIVRVALPGQPVEVFGFATLPPVGGQITVGRELPLAAPVPAVSSEPVSPEPVVEATPDEEKVKIILKADASGTLEAIKASLPKECQIMKAEAGDVNESDVALAETVKAAIIAFNVKLSASVKKLAEIQGVKISEFKIIYELLKAITDAVAKQGKSDLEENVLGRSQVIAEFKIKNIRIAGVKVSEGEITNQNPVFLKRGDQILGTARIKSLRVGKTDVLKVKAGEECGLVLSPALDFAVGDMLVSFRKAEV
ncbi:translation initiation factor IF-2 [Candidatus Shapirobacteria bacterium CG09_land_8_20_14_0_10_47_13]|uniref:Translation initiation factor IF-2 n=1 Tax=Candidatus Shapirobacteria bacterium CG09_land_8_20_14_0_10_47_13 TaxID=1974481 RepID=A0A2H0WNA3_9BACT|nr:MAG: translation initiation factor IF-2 [Candidatus Shapirobacteria bacterium CG09_land_8_20_14_0_10_47_13]